MMDITRRTGFLKDVQQNEALFINHRIHDGESPIILADRIYDDSNLYWVIMLFNEMHNISVDWPLDGPSLVRYIERAYDDPYGLHHYESLANGAIVSVSWPDYDRISVSNTEHEIEQNDQKRDIKIPVPEAVDLLVREHNRLIQQ
jgi:hypothetical protein